MVYTNIHGETGVYFSEQDYASFLQRIIIICIDIAVYFFLIFIFLCFYSFIFNLDSEQFSNNVIFCAGSILAILYFAVLKRSKIRTLGYIIAGVKIVTIQGGKPSILLLIFRFLLLIFGPLLIIDFFWLLNDKNKQTLYDKITGTYVIKKNALYAGEGAIKYVRVFVLFFNFIYREVCREKGINI